MSEHEETPAAATVTIRGRIFTLPKLNLGSLKKVGGYISTAQGIQPGDIPNEAQIDAMIAIVHASAKKAEPELTREEFADHVEGCDWDDLSLVDAFMLVMTGSGLTKGERNSAGEGESPASSISSPSTGS